MALDYYYDKEKLPRNKKISYPIKRTELDNALEKAGVTELKNVFFGFQNDKSKKIEIIYACMSGESFSGYWKKQIPDICISAVPSELRNEINGLLKKQNVLEKVTQWLVELESASNVRRDRTQKLWVYYLDGKLLFKKT